MPKTATRIAVADRCAATSVVLEMDVLSRAETRRPDIEATKCTEVRWFIPGEGPPLKGVPVRSCTDSYRGDLLADGVSVKSRAGNGEGVFVKLRSAVLAPVAIGDLRGMPETWARWEVEALPRSAAEVHVHKTIARRKGVEIAQLVVHDEEWWSVAVRIQGPKLPSLPREIEAHLSRRSGAAICCSYTAWLVLHANQQILRGSTGQHGMRIEDPRRADKDNDEDND